ncbi:MAG: signal peptidase I [Clostridia bacterium]|nr:signal peptidase I [Clostridia bacterium]
MSENEKNVEVEATQETEAEATELVTEADSSAEAKKEEPTVKMDKKTKFQLNVYDFVSIIMSAFIIIAFIFVFAFRLVGVKGESMESTLHGNDWLITMQKSEYVYGDIVVTTKYNYFNEPLIKRVIATGGQTIDIDFASSTVYVDGKALDEPYINESFMVEKIDFMQFPYTVPEGYLFCMGDNRNYSTDSRSTLIGAIDEKHIMGKAVVRILPFGDFDIYDYEQKEQ